MNQPTAFTLSLPTWAIDRLTALPTTLPTPLARMDLVLDLARRNVEADTGGPFAAAVFNRESGQLIALGVNQVVAGSCSSAHAEVLALALAQQRLGVYDLGGPGQATHELVVNWRPCAMCFGALLWSGIRHLTIAGSGPELEDLTGFDEGPIHPHWREELARRGIGLTEDVRRAEAISLFRWFQQSGRIVYNARQA